MPPDARCAIQVTLATQSNVCCALLLISLRRIRRLRRQLQHGGRLAFRQKRQQHHFAIRKFDGVVVPAWLILVDLPEDRRVEDEPPRFAHAGRADNNLLGERKLCSGENADRGGRILRRGEPAGARAEVSSS